MTLQGDAANCDAAAARHAWCIVRPMMRSSHPRPPPDQHFRAGLRRRGIARLPGARRTRDDRRRHRRGKLEMLRRGQAPIVETGIQELTRSRHRGRQGQCHRLVARCNYLRPTCRSSASARQRAPTAARTWLRSRASLEQIGAVLPEKATRHVIVIRSTVKPGTVEEVIRPAHRSSFGAESRRRFQLCFQPEFLREGTSINDYDNPPLTVVGARRPAWRCRIARDLRSPAVRVRAHLDPHRRDAQVRVQRVPRREGDLCQRDRSHLAVGAASIRTK